MFNNNYFDNLVVEVLEYLEKDKNIDGPCDLSPEILNVNESDLTEVVRNLQDNGYILGVNIDGPYIGDNEPTVDAKNCRITLKGLQYLEYLKKEKS